MQQFNPRLRISGIALIAAFMLTGSAFGQYSTVTLTVEGPLPIAKGILEIERLSGVPINYEDVRWLYAGDMEDVTNTVGPEQRALAEREGRTLHVVAPRRGTLSFPALIDARTGKIPDATATTAALNALIQAHNASTLPGRFSLETYNGVPFVQPFQMRDVTGSIVSVTPVLATRVTLPPVKRNAGITLQMILDQVSKASGFSVGIGSVPINGLAMTELILGADSEPANHLIAQFWEKVYKAGSGNPSTPGIAYRLVFHPRTQKNYILNVVEVANPNPPPITSEANPLPSTNSDRFFKKIP